MPRLRRRRESFVWWRILDYVASHFVCYISPFIFTLSEETTPGVYQASGYGDIAANKSVWFVLHLVYSSVYICDPPNRFWFFAARKNPDKAPLITWFNGGVSDTVRQSILNYSGIISARKFEHAWIVSGAGSLPYQQPKHRS